MEAAVEAATRQLQQTVSVSASTTVAGAGPHNEAQDGTIEMEVCF